MRCSYRSPPIDDVFDCLRVRKLTGVWPLLQRGAKNRETEMHIAEQSFWI